MEKRQLDSLRFERKYIIEKDRSWIFRNMLKEKKFSKLYKKRKVISIYFDTANFKYFKENIEGVGSRIKPRLRWYEYSDNKEKSLSTTLEIKKKKGFVGSKKQFNFGKYSCFSDIIKNIKNYDIKNNISKIVKEQVYPILITSYNREYYINNNNKIRSTIDTNLEVIPINNISFKLPLFKEILEIKYNISFDDEYRRLISGKNFKFRFQKYSKYVTGLLFLKKNGLI